MNSGTLDRQISESEDARRILAEPLVKAFFDEAKEKLSHALYNCPVDERCDTFRHIRGQIDALTAFEGFFKSYVATGKLADDLAEQIKSGAFDNL